MHFRPHRYALRTLALVLSIVALAAGCTPRRVGFGVLLWSPDETVIASGTVVSVITASELTDSYVVSAPDLREGLHLPRWRVELFAEESQALEYAGRYAASLDDNPALHAIATRAALPVRSRAQAASGNVLYRLRENEVVKLIGRQPEPTNLEGLVSYWYEALTETGTRGWVFGHTLRLYDPNTDSAAAHTGTVADPLVEILVNTTWRPVSFVEMISGRAIDLDRFRPEYGLFHDPERLRFQLVLRTHAAIFEYTEIVNVGPRRYVAEGTTLQITFQRDNELSIQYLHNGRQQLASLQKVSGEIEDYIAAEVERRESVYSRLMERGPEFTSDHYGTLRFLDGARFVWEGYARLVPGAISQGAGTAGRVDLGLFLPAAIRGQYDGGVVFLFDGSPDPVRFMYTVRDDGMRLVYVPPADVRDRVVQRESPTPLIIFMSVTGQ